MKQAEIRYKCRCMQDEGTLHMQARGKLECIDDFMYRLGHALGADHKRRSPLCVATAVEYVRLPVTDDEGVGGVKGGTA